MFFWEFIVGFVEILTFLLNNIGQQINSAQYICWWLPTWLGNFIHVKELIKLPFKFSTLLYFMLPCFCYLVFSSIIVIYPYFIYISSNKLLPHSLVIHFGKTILERKCAFSNRKKYLFIFNFQICMCETKNMKKIQFLKKRNEKISF